MFKIIVRGVVQGVGFRPFVYNKAIERDIKGYIRNTGDGVEIVCDKKESILEILDSPPELARIDNIEVYELDVKIGYENFSIKESERTNSYSPIPADLNACRECIEELFDKENPRHRYFFISCTNCGPRYSIIDSTPYDRENTALSDFVMCKMCRKEYEDPENRRYHAQTVACKRCGPKVRLYKDNEAIEEVDAIKEAARLLDKGEVIAIKGVGGFHLACSIDKRAILKLKETTNRYHKPFALMAKDIDMIKKYAKINPIEESALLSNKRPVVLAEKKDKGKMRDVSELSSLGFMLAYSPLHYLLFEYIDYPIILTSSNMASFPITTKREEQFVEYVLDYNRRISNSVDDSIIKVIGNNPLIIRRSRGYAPGEICIPEHYQIESSDLLGIGAELKNTFCIKKGNKLILSQHIGDTHNLENFANFKDTLSKLLEFSKTEPEIIIRDKNNSFNTSNFANEFSLDNDIELMECQHHVAHGFSAAIEHNLEDFIAIVCDGTGLGDDGRAWGGEVFHNDKRVGRLEYQSLVGGDYSNKEPARMLVGILTKFLSLNEITKLLGDTTEVRISHKQKKENFNCIESSSCGRVLDCVSILLEFSDKNYYEGRGAMLLESNSKMDAGMFFEPVIEEQDGLLVLKTTELFEFIVDNLEKVPKEELAGFAQKYIAKGFLRIAREYDKGLPVVFSGGVAYNSVISEYMIENGVLLNKDIPCGDGGISAGQIAYYLWSRKRDCS